MLTFFYNNFTILLMNKKDAQLYKQPCIEHNLQMRVHLWIFVDCYILLASLELLPVADTGCSQKRFVRHNLFCCYCYSCKILRHKHATLKSSICPLMMEDDIAVSMAGMITGVMLHKIKA